MSEWARQASHSNAGRLVINRVQHLRRLMLVHSCIYYELDDSIVSDHQWTEWAQELYRIQHWFGHWFNFYDALFAGWNGSTGHHLKYDADVIRVARRLLGQQKVKTV